MRLIRDTAVAVGVTSELSSRYSLVSVVEVGSSLPLLRCRCRHPVALRKGEVGGNDSRCKRCKPSSKTPVSPFVRYGSLGIQATEGDLF